MIDMKKFLLSAVENHELRPIDAQFAIMVATKNEPELMLAAALVSKSTGDGHVCLPLSNLNKKITTNQLKNCFSLLNYPIDWYKVLLNSSAVSEAGGATPLIIYNHRLYLNYLWHNEHTVANFFTKGNYLMHYNEKKIFNILNKLFGTNKNINWHKIAAAVILTRRISIVYGGPGTGKTTIAAKLILALMKLFDKNKKYRIKLIAPTGKAAARFTESFNSTLNQLNFNKKQLKYIPDKATTLHKLLGMQINSKNLRYHAKNQLHLDLIVVDEASMIDLTMMSHLINALPDHAKIILLGDPNQLSSVEPGSILSDICRYATQGYSQHRAHELTRITGFKIEGFYKNKSTSTCLLRDSLCFLKKNYRFNKRSYIGILAKSINNGDYDSVKNLFKLNLNSIKKKSQYNNQQYFLMLKEAIKGYNTYLLRIKEKATPKSILIAFSKYQILCAIRDGIFGVIKFNEFLEKELIKQNKIKKNSPSNWYEGRPIMIVQNCNILGLFNGDIGILLDRGKGLRAWFMMPGREIKSIQPSRLPKHETAWAITVHKSQGSEFDHITLVLPLKMNQVITRELIYTAITRARYKITLYTLDDILEQAISTQTKRYSGLKDMLDNIESSL